MKTLILLTILLTSLSAYSASVSCVTNPPSTSFFYSDSGNNGPKLEVVHHQGIEHAPLINGIVTGYTLDLAKKRLTYSKEMGSQFKVLFDQKSCKVSQEKTSCYHTKGKSKIGELEVEDYGFLIYAETDSSIYGDFEQYQARFNYRVNGWPHEMSLTYGKNDCYIKE